MDDIEIKIEKVLERDIDLLLINKFIYERKVINYFLNKINKKDFKLLSIEHSRFDKEFGESDITIILENNNSKIALLIENKITAQAMPFQQQRYKERGNIGINKGEYEEYYLFITAPKQYLEYNEEAKLYANNISYEELIEVMSDDIFATFLLKKAIQEKENKYISEYNKNVTNFWTNYYNYISDKYSIINMNYNNMPKSSLSTWVYFKTKYNKVTIIHKTELGIIDLCFDQMAKYRNIFNELIKNISNDNIIKQIGNTLNITINVPIIDVNKEFNNCIEEIEKCVKGILYLYSILDNLDMNALNNELNKDCKINNIDEFNNITLKKGIIVNYDKRIVYRASTGDCEKIADGVDYPYIQRYQKGLNPISILFIINNGIMRKLERIEKYNENSHYKLLEVEELISDNFYNNEKFNEKGKNPVNVKREKLLEIDEKIL